MNIRMTKLKWDPAKKEAFLAACDANQQNVGKTPGLQYGQLVELSPGVGILLVFYDDEKVMDASKERLAKNFQPLDQFLIAPPERESGEIIGEWGTK